MTFDPTDIVGHACINPIKIRASAAITKANDPSQLPTTFIIGHDQGAATVTLARILAACRVASTEHILIDRAIGKVTDLISDDGHRYFHQHNRRTTPFASATPPRDNTHLPICD